VAHGEGLKARLKARKIYRVPWARQGDLRRAHFLLGLGVGLYLSRVLAEGGIRPWPVALTLGAACVALTTVALTRMRRPQLNLYPLYLCYGYVLYPRPHPSLAMALGLMALWGVVIANSQANGGTLPEVLILLGGLALYVCTLAPTLLPADAGEFQLVASLLGVAHPPGYPLYTLLGKLFTLIPWGDPAYRVNLLSAVVGALTLAAVSWAVRQLTPNPWPRLAASLALGGATTFWAQATTAGIRSLTALFTASILALTLSYGRAYERGQRSHCCLTALGVVFGLGITHHGSLGFLALPVGAYLISVDRALITQPRQWLRPLAAAVLSLSVLLYLPLRDAMGAPMSPGDLTTLRGFTEHIAAKGFRGDMFAFARLSLLPDRLAVLREALLMQFGGPLLLAMGIAGALLLRRGSRRASALILGSLLINAFVGLTYRAPQTVEYLMPSYVCLALLLGGGLGKLLSSPVSHPMASVLALLTTLVLYLGTAQLLAHYPSFALLHDDRSARDYAEELLQSAPPQATILANWHYFTPLRYLQMVEGWRPDVTIRYVHPRGGTSLPDLWLAEIAQYIQGEEGGDGAPVIVTNFFPQFEASPYRFCSLGGAFLVLGPEGRTDTEALLSNFTPLDVALDGTVKLMGYRLEGKAIGSHRPLVLLLAWQLLSPVQEDISFFAHLVGDDGMPIAQADVRQAMRRYRTGEIWVTRHVLFLRPTILPVDYTLIVGAYTPLAGGGWRRLGTPMGTDHIPLDRVAVRPSSLPPVTLYPLYRPFAKGITLLGVDYDDSYPASRRVYLHWYLAGKSPAANVLLLSQDHPRCQMQLPENGPHSTYLSTTCDIPPESSSLAIALRRAEDDEALSTLGPWHLPWGKQSTLPSPRQGSRYLSLGGEMALTSAHIEPGIPSTLRLNFVALWPITRDYTLSLRLHDTEGRWQVQRDGTPVQGAIPTLKWIRGTRVTDVQYITPPPGVALGRARYDLLVYDAFTVAPLPPLDERLLARGVMVPLGEVSWNPAAGER